MMTGTWCFFRSSTQLRASWPPTITMRSLLLLPQRTADSICSTPLASTNTGTSPRMAAVKAACRMSRGTAASAVRASDQAFAATKASSICWRWRARRSPLSLGVDELRRNRRDRAAGHVTTTPAFLRSAMSALVQPSSCMMDARPGSRPPIGNTVATRTPLVRATGMAVESGLTAVAASASGDISPSSSVSTDCGTMPISIKPSWVCGEIIPGNTCLPPRSMRTGSGPSCGSFGSPPFANTAWIFPPSNQIVPPSMTPCDTVWMVALLKMIGPFCGAAFESRSWAVNEAVMCSAIHRAPALVKLVISGLLRRCGSSSRC